MADEMTFDDAEFNDDSSDSNEDFAEDFLNQFGFEFEGSEYSSSDDDIDETENDSEDAETDEKETTEESVEEDTKAESTKEEESKQSTEKSEEKKEDKKEPEKPPKDYVPLEALHKVRNENRYLKKQISDLSRDIESLKTEKEDSSQWKDFTPLTDEALTTLAEEDPTAAFAHMLKREQYNAFKMKREAAEREREYREKDAYEREMNEIEDAVAEIERSMPGLYSTTDSKVRDALTAKAKNVGFDESMYHLVDPALKVMIPSRTPEGKIVYSSPRVLGNDAAKLLKLLGKIEDRESIINAERAKIEAEVTEKLKIEEVKKISSRNKSKSQYVSVKDSGSPKNDHASRREPTVDELMRMTASERVRYGFG